MASPLPGPAPTGSQDHEVVVVGAGLAGLCCAVHLARAGRDVRVLEASDAVGGRVRTDLVDGLQLDRGFQLYNPAYPEGRRMLDHEQLDLRGFTRGVQVALREPVLLADPRALPSTAVAALLAPVGPVLDRARFALYALQCARRSPAELRQRPDVTAEQALRQAGVGRQLLDRVVRPFLAGVFLEADLTTSRRFLDLVLRSFVRGTPSVPAAGMQAIPEQLAAAAVAAGATVTTEAAVQSLEPNGAGWRLHSATGDVSARAVVVAAGPRPAAALLGLPEPRTHAVTTWYHLADTPPSLLADGRPTLAVDGYAAGPLVNAVVLTAAAPEYAPGRVLVSSSALGLPEAPGLDRAVLAHLRRLFGQDSSGWQLVATYRVPDALPAAPPPLDVRQPVRLGDGRYLAGDQRDTPSIQGAMVSGRRAAEAVLADLAADGRPA